MENDCLVTKLKGVVDNNSLPRIGMLRVYVLNNTAVKEERTMVVNFTEVEQKIVLEGNIHFTDSTLTEDRGQVLQIDSLNTSATFYVSSGTGTIIMPKYNLMTIRTSHEYHSTTNFYYDFSDFAYTESLDYLALNGSTLTNMKYLVKSPLSNLTLQYCNFNADEDFAFIQNKTTVTTVDLIGVTSTTNHLNIDIEKFGGCIAVTSVNNKYGNAIKGTLERMLESMCVSRVSGNLTIIGGNITFNNVVRESQTVFTVAFNATGCTVTIGGNTNTYTKASSTWTYA